MKQVIPFHDFRPFSTRLWATCPVTSCAYTRYRRPYRWALPLLRASSLSLPSLTSVFNFLSQRPNYIKTSLRTLLSVRWVRDVKNSGGGNFFKRRWEKRRLVKTWQLMWRQSKHRIAVIGARLRTIVWIRRNIVTHVVFHAKNTQLS